MHHSIPPYPRPIPSFLPGRNHESLTPESQIEPPTFLEVSTRTLAGRRPFLLPAVQRRVVIPACAGMTE